LENVDVCYGHWEYFTDIGDILRIIWYIGIVVIWYIFPVFGNIYQENLATLPYLAWWVRQLAKEHCAFLPTNTLKMAHLPKVPITSERHLGTKELFFEKVEIEIMLTTHI
jgi:hypothetical protein